MPGPFQVAAFPSPYKVSFLFYSSFVAMLAFPSALLRMLTSNVKHEDWHSWWNIFYMHCFWHFPICIFKALFKQEPGQQERRYQSASVDSRSALKCFLKLVSYLYCCFFVAAFTLFAPFQVGLNVFMSFVMCIFLLLYVQASLPSPSGSPQLFFARACVARDM
jgi:hypothetical protein